MARKISEYGPEELATIDYVEATRETDLAIGVKVACPVDEEHMDGFRMEWIPKSQIHDDSEVWKNNQKGKLVIPEWLARAKDLV